MTPALRFLIDAATCPRCAGVGVLHSVAAKYVGEPWHTHRECDLCEGSGINPAIGAETFHGPQTPCREGEPDAAG